MLWKTTRAKCSLIASIILVSAACSETYERVGGNVSVENTAGGPTDDRFDNGNGGGDPNNTYQDDEFDTGSASSKTTGAALVTLTYDNASTRCSVKVNGIVAQSICDAMADNEEAHAIEEGLTLSWDVPIATDKSEFVTNASCSLLANDLKQTCVFIVSSVETPVKFALNLQEGPKTRTVTNTVPVVSDLVGDPFPGSLLYVHARGIVRFDLDQTNAQEVFADLFSTPHSGTNERIRYSADTGKLYATTPDSLVVLDTDGANPLTLKTAMIYDMVTGALTDGTIKIFYVSAGKVFRMNTDGSGVQQLFSSSNSLERIAFDANIQKVFFMEKYFNGGSTTYYIKKMDADGGNVETLITGGSLQAFAIDSASQRLYYSSTFSLGSILYISYEGGSATTLLSNTHAQDIAIDQQSQKIFWRSGTKIYRANLSAPHLEEQIEELATSSAYFASLTLDDQGKVYFRSPDGLMRCDRDGSNSEAIVNPYFNNVGASTYDIPNRVLFTYSDNTDKVYKLDLNTMKGTAIIDHTDIKGLAVDSERGRLYFADHFFDRIAATDYLGSAVATLFSVTDPKCLYYDSVEDKIYWCDHADAKIKRANPDGSSQEDVITFTSSEVPHHIAIIDHERNSIYYARKAGGYPRFTAQPFGSEDNGTARLVGYNHNAIQVNRFGVDIERDRTIYFGIEDSGPPWTYALSARSDDGTSSGVSGYYRFVNLFVLPY